ncbi:hypothetical protein BB559_002501 [Furculomyces boomerangus]|uniref:Uncharacterized protein n=1 Tax=Furculomyces boomerangus TaxID=61424 RepID=A0A2T9YUX6_9FUNG|nr:hypothetical protein BB559_002501 [Furculomyces boomerangus]
MRAELKVPKDQRTLNYVESLKCEDEKLAAYKKIKEIEDIAKASMELQPGFKELFDYLDSRGILKGIITLNNSETVNHMLENVIPAGTNGRKVDFEHILTREFGMIKPDPTPLLHIAEKWGLKPEEIIMVGDSADDIECGHNAGSLTILLKNDVNQSHTEIANIAVSRLDHIIELFEYEV